MEELGIRIKVELPKGLDEVHQLVQKYFNDNPFKINLGSGITADLSKIKTQMEEIKRVFKSIDGDFSKKSITFDNTGEPVKTVTDIKVAYNEVLRVIQQANKENINILSINNEITKKLKQNLEYYRAVANTKIDNTINKIDGKIDTSQLDVLKNKLSSLDISENLSHEMKMLNLEISNTIKNLNIQLKGQQEIEQALLETERNRRLEAENLAKAQGKAVSKVQNDNYKQQLIEQEKLIVNEQKLTLFQKQSAIDVIKLKHQYKDLYDTNTLKQYINKVQQLTPATKNLTYQTQLLNKEFGLIKASAMEKGFDATNKSATSLLSSLKLIAYKFSTWLLMGNLFMGFYHQIGAGITFIKDLDSAFTNLKKVTNETKEVYAGFAKEASEIGRQLAKTTVEVVDATTTFAKMGFTLNEAKELAKTALITSNVGDINVDQSTEYLIASVKAYNIAAEDSIRITDILNSVQNQHATTVEVLGEGLKRTANSMQLAGASIEQTVAMITAVQAVSQRGGEVIGNALRTIAFRLRGIDEESGELLPSLEGDLDRVGVKLKSADGGFRNIYEVIKDLSVVWKNLDSFTQADLLEKIAGKRQGEILATLLNNFAESELALEHALNSLGSAAQENETYMKSVEAKINQFQVSLENLYQTFMNSSSLVGFINIGQWFINILTGMTNSIGGFNTLLLTTGTVALAISSKFRVFMLTLNTKVLNLFGLSITELYRKLIILTGGATSARLAISALYGTMTLGIGLVAGFAIEGIVKLITKMGEAAREQKEYYDQLSSSAKNLFSEITSTEELIGTYKELSTKMNLTTQEKTKLADITNKLAQIMPGAVEQYDLEGNAISLNSKELEKYVELKKEELDLNRRSLETEFYVSFDKEIKNLEEARNKLNKNKEEIIRLENLIKEKTSLPKKDYDQWDQNMVKDAKEKIEKLNIEQKNLTSTMGEITSKTKSQAKAFLTLSDNLKGLSDTDVNNIVDTLFKSVDKVDNNAIKSFLQTISTSKEASDAIKNINKQMNEYKAGNVSAANAQKNVNEQLKILREILTKLNVDPQMIEAFMAAFNTENIKTVNKEVDSFKNSCISLQQSLLDTSSNLQSLNKAMQEYSESGEFNLKTILDLSKTYPQLLGYLEDEEALRKELISIIEDEENIQKTAYANMLLQSENFYNSKIKGNAQLVQSINNQYNTLFQQLGIAYNYDLGNFKNLASAKSIVEQKLIQQLAEMWSHYYDVVSGTVTDLYMEDLIASQEYAGTEIGDKMAESMAPAVKLVNELNKVKKSFQDIALEVSGVDFSTLNLGDTKSSSGSSSALDKTLEKWESVRSKIEQEYKELSDLLSRKIDLGIVSGLDIMSEKLKIEEDKLNKIFDARSNLSKELIKYQAKLNNNQKLTAEEESNIQTIIQQINGELAQWNSYEESQLSIVQKLKSEYEAISTPLNNLNDIIKSTLNNLKKTSSEIQNIISNFKVSLDLSTSKIDIKGFDDLKDVYNNISSALKKNIVADTSAVQSANQLIKAKDSIIAKAKSLLSLTNLTKDQEQEIKAILQNQYSTQIRQNLAESGILKKLEQEKEIYKEIQEFEEKLANKKQKQENRIDDIQDEIDALNDEADVESKSEQIADAKLKIKEQEVTLQEKLNDLLEIEADITGVLADKRFELITVQGERVLTYDVEKYNDLIDQREDIQKSVSEASQAVVDAQQDYTELKRDLARQEQIEELELEKETAQKKLDAMDEKFNKEREKYAKQLMKKYKDYFESENDLVTIATDGANGRLDAIYKEITEKRKLYDVQVKDAYTAGQNIAQAQIAGMQSQEVPTNVFTQLVQTKIEPVELQQEQQVTEESQSIEQTQTQTDLELKAEEEKQKSILEIIKNSAKERLAQILLNQKEYTTNFVDYWKLTRSLEIAQFKDIGQVYATGYNALLETFKQYIVQQRKLWISLKEDAYAAGRAIANSFKSGRLLEIDYSSISWSDATYKQLTYAPTFTPASTVNNAVTIVLTQSESSAVISAISAYLPNTIRSNL